MIPEYPCIRAYIQKNSCPSEVPLLSALVPIPGDNCYFFLTLASISGLNSLVDQLSWPCSERLSWETGRDVLSVLACMANLSHINPEEGGLVSPSSPPSLSPTPYLTNRTLSR